MKPQVLFTLMLALALLLLAAAGIGHAQDPQPDGLLAPQAPLGNAFTYQGKLSDGGNPANGLYDFVFTLYDAESGGTPLGSPVTFNDQTVTNGLFTIVLDFGAGVFNGEARWLEVGVRPGTSSDPYTTLSPRKALTAAPYALFSKAAPWSGLSGVPPGFADNTDNDTLGSLSCGNGQVAKWNGSTWTCASDNDTTTFWSLSGNAATTPGTNFLGTTDNQALEFKVNNARVLRLEPNATSPNIIGGFSGNSVTAGVKGATIGGGGLSNNTNRVTDDYGTVGGGANNQAGDGSGTTSDRLYATVGGGYSNTASGSAATVGGGYGNTTSGVAATVGGGSANTASGSSATVGGGDSNIASGISATVGGGQNNTASSFSATVGGGSANTASGVSATVGGGLGNTAAGDYSFVVGRRAKNTDTAHDGVFLFADSKNFDFLSTDANQFRVRATGGAQFVLAIDGSGNPTWTCSVTSGNSWSCSSDRNLKENLTRMDGIEVLTQLMAMPIYSWSAKGGDPSVRHMGPMAQDFYAAFGLGQDDKSISTIDLDGVALASIQGLYHLLQEKDAEIAALKAHNAAQQAQIDDLEARLAALEKRLGGAPSQANALPLYGSALGGLLLLGLLGYRHRKGGAL